MEKLPVRVRVRLESLRSGGKIIEALALLNTGFISDELDVHAPKSLAEELGLWASPWRSYNGNLGCSWR